MLLWDVHDILECADMTCLAPGGGGRHAQCHSRHVSLTAESQLKQLGERPKQLTSHQLTFANDADLIN